MKFALLGLLLASTQPNISTQTVIQTPYWAVVNVMQDKQEFSCMLVEKFQKNPEEFIVITDFGDAPLSITINNDGWNVKQGKNQMIIGNDDFQFDPIISDKSFDLLIDNENMKNFVADFQSADKITFITTDGIKHVVPLATNNVQGMTPLDALAGCDSMFLNPQPQSTPEPMPNASLKIQSKTGDVEL